MAPASSASIFSASRERAETTSMGTCDVSHGADDFLAVDVGERQFDKNQVGLLGEDQLDGLEAQSDGHGVETGVVQFLFQDPWGLG